jgi:hypothetical protein
MRFQASVQELCPFQLENVGKVQNVITAAPVLQTSSDFDHVHINKLFTNPLNFNEVSSSARKLCPLQPRLLKGPSHLPTRVPATCHQKYSTLRFPPSPSGIVMMTLSKHIYPRNMNSSTTT